MLQLNAPPFASLDVDGKDQKETNPYYIRKRQKMYDQMRK